LTLFRPPDPAIQLGLPTTGIVIIFREAYNILFRWFVGLSIEAPVWDATVFTKNRDRLLEGNIAHRFLQAILADPQVKRLLSSEHFSVDGTLIEAWASMKSFRPKDGSGAPPRSRSQWRA